jgi:hypothetical protein
MSGSVKRGLDLALYRNTATYAAPVWRYIGNVKDLALNKTMSEGDASARIQKVKMLEPCLEEASFGWAMNDDPSDPDLLAIQAAYDGRTLIEFAFADGDITAQGTQYLRYECKIFDISEPQPLDNVNVVNVMAKPCYTTNEQGKRVTVG